MSGQAKKFFTPIISIVSSGAILLSPILSLQVFAQVSTPAPAVAVTNFSSLLFRLEQIISIVVPFLVAVAIFIIVYGILGYISHAADEEKRKQAKDFITWGVIGVFFMLSIWGLVTILINSFGLDNSADMVTRIYAPLPVSATVPTTLPQLINRAMALGSILIPFLISIAVGIIVFGIINYIRKADNEEKRAEARQFVIWGVIGVFIMLSIWGFVAILLNSFQLQNVVPVIPALQSLPAA